MTGKEPAGGNDYEMLVGFGGTQAAAVPLAQPAPRRVVNQETHRPVTEADEVDLRPHDKAERRDDRQSDTAVDGESLRVEDGSREIDIQVSVRPHITAQGAP